MFKILFNSPYIMMNFFVCFQISLITADISPPSSPELNTLKQSLAPKIPRSIVRDIRPFPPCSDTARRPKYASNCTLWFTSAYPTDDDPNPLDLSIFGPGCMPLLLFQTSLPLDKNITINTAPTKLVGDLSIEIANGSWYNMIMYKNQRLDFELPEDDTGTPYYPDDFMGRVVRWSGFECEVNACVKMGGVASGSCDAGAGVAKIDEAVYR